MKLTSIDADNILMLSHSSSEDESSSGFFKKLIGKVKDPTPSLYQLEVKTRGVSRLREEILSEDTVAFRQENPNQEYPVVLTPKFLIIPGVDIIKFRDVAKFGLFNYLENEGAHWYYFNERISEPYDPTYVSEYEGEETFELDRFKVTLVTVCNGERIEYNFLLDKDDRAEFVALFAERSGAKNFTDEDVLKGEFDGDFEENSGFYKITNERW